MTQLLTRAVEAILASEPVDVAHLVGLPLASVRGRDGFVIQRTAELLGPCYIISFQEGPGRRNEGDAASASQPRRTYVRF